MNDNFNNHFCVHQIIFSFLNPVSSCLRDETVHSKPTFPSKYLVNNFYFNLHPSINEMTAKARIQIYD